MKTKKFTSGYKCLECGHVFKTVAAAMRALHTDEGCPKCGGVDIDLDVGPIPTTPKAAENWLSAT